MTGAELSAKFLAKVAHNISELVAEPCHLGQA